MAYEAILEVIQYLPILQPTTDSSYWQSNKEYMLKIRTYFLPSFLLFIMISLVSISDTILSICKSVANRFWGVLELWFTTYSGN